ncbi:MAG: 16S rRNA (guanine(527)-N(7))-methyltransferase RsmG, partial [Alphaproteobacteria bacterium]|nr:16S rRNA (guanine(527)-N(7))-methyltransferase RsmG [Alphaproteobacteria bacterium]
GQNTVDSIWERHVLDSAQLIAHLPSEPSQVADFGAGAGFPGIVLSILTNHSITCIESTQKKAQFLNHVVEELSLSVHIINSRIEDLEPMEFDVITARALAPLSDLIKLARPHLKKSGYMLLLKGQSYAEEIKRGQMKWMFTCQEFESITNEKSRVLKISDVKPKSRGAR